MKLKISITITPLEKELVLLNDKLIMIEKDNMKLLKQLQDSQISNNRLIQQNIQLLENKQKLLEQKSNKKFW